MNDIPLVICKSRKDLTKFFHHNNIKFLDRLCTSIKYGVEDDLKKITLCDITFDGTTKFRVNLYQKDYKDALHKLLQIHEGAEEYERCAIVKKLIKKIK